MRDVRIVFVVIVLLGFPSIGAAQERIDHGKPADPAEPSLASPLTPGSRVRVWSTVVQELRGVVLAIDETNLTLGLEDRPPLEIPVSSITNVDVSIGEKSHTLRGTIIGGVGMALLGLTWSVDPNDCSDDSIHFCSRSEAVGAGALTGALLGALVGALIRSEEWAPMTIRF
jgi:hypothetical protein